MRYTKSAVAKKVEVSPSTVERWMTTGVRGRILRSYLVGGRRYVDPRDLEIFLAHGSTDAPDKSQCKAADAAADELNSRWGI